jgi:hypothetical protein
MKKQDELLILVANMLKALGGTFEIKPEDTFDLDQEIVILTDPETLVTTIQLRDKKEEEGV